MQLRILLVDDDASTVRALSTLLRSEGHTVTTCLAPAPALDALHAGPFDVLLTDQVMGGMSGTELARIALVLQPGLRCFIVSGVTPLPSEERPNVGWVSKPVDIDVLLATLASDVG